MKKVIEVKRKMKIGRKCTHAYITFMNGSKTIARRKLVDFVFKPKNNMKVYIKGKEYIDIKLEGAIES